LVKRRQFVDAKSRGCTAGASVHFTKLIDLRAMSFERRVARFPASERVSEHGSCPTLQLGRKLINRFVLALELEAVILQRTAHRQRGLLSPRIVNDLARPARCITLNERHGDLCTLDGRT